MISVLIPVYNYEVLDLVNTIHRQLTNSSVTFEIICFDDGSENYYVKINSKINELKNTHLHVSDKNVGRIKARQFLSDQAKYNWLLFLDADVMPKNETFIKQYIECVNKSYDVFYGGFSYDKIPPSYSSILRWKYGIKNEEVSAEMRNKKPYKVIISANFLIKKPTFSIISNYVDYNAYGLDSYIGSELKKQMINVLHIDNNVLHLGLEESKTFLKKKEQAAETLLKLIAEENIINYDNSLLSLFLKLKKLKINYLFSFLFSVLKKPIKKNLLGKNPSITLLQGYRIGYMCYSDLNPKANK